MRIFVAPPLKAGELTITGDEHHYLARVRRAAVGDQVELCDGEGLRAPAEVTKITDTQSTLRVGDVQQIADRPPRIRALASAWTPRSRSSSRPVSTRSSSSPRRARS
jgi:16S rRNA U1498 N3-methylase RsmE